MTILPFHSLPWLLADPNSLGDLVVFYSNRQVCHALAGIVVKKSDLIITCPAGIPACNQLSQLMDLTPAYEPSFRPFPESALLILIGLFDSVDDDQ